MNTGKVILYIAMSLDGYIAKPNDDLSFLQIVEQSGEDYGYTEFISSVDTVIMGRKTYDWIMKNVSEFPHSNLETYIITKSLHEKQEKINFYSGNLKELTEELKIKNGKNIFCDGGAEIVNELLKTNSIDEMIISIIPILLGNGKRLFSVEVPEQKLELISANTFEKGLVQLHYKVLNR